MGETHGGDNGRGGKQIRVEINVPADAPLDEVETKFFDELVASGLPHEMAARMAHDAVSHISDERESHDQAREPDNPYRTLLDTLEQFDKLLKAGRRINRLYMVMIVTGVLIQLVWIAEMLLDRGR